LPATAAQSGESPRRQLARQDRHQRIVAKLVVIVQVFVAQGDREHALTHQSRHAMLDELGPPPILKASREPLDQTDRPIRRPQQQPARIRSQRPAVKIGQHRPPFDGCKHRRVCATLRLHRGRPPARLKSFSQNNFR
jgi:hypothetical protein